jgi:hypothetical protein
MNKAVWSAGARLASGVVLVLASASCGTLTRQGTSPAYLIIQSIEAATGNDPDTFKSFLLSDVITVVNDVPTIFNDVARVTFSLGLKDPGPAASPTAATQNNWITVDQYHVRFIRADGHNIEGIDVPYAFDGGLTATVSDTVTAGFQIVRHNAKEEAPLAALQVSPVIISTVAEITFYGHDQTGREVSATGRLGVNFGNFADPKN